MDTAADVERIRQALSPNDGLVAYGGSYGSPYATAYLERYGDHVKALVLDGVVDHSVDLPTFIARNVLAVNEAFGRFANWCEQDSACALHGRDLAIVFDAAIATAPAIRTVVPQRMAAGRDPQLGWPTVAQMLAQVSDGDTSALEALAGGAHPTSTAGRPLDSLPGPTVCTTACCAPTSGRSGTTPPLPLPRKPSLVRRRASPGGSGTRPQSSTARPGSATALGGPLKPGTHHTACRLARTPTCWWRTPPTTHKPR